jgi:carbon monoxide dehydrogenase subunit G
MKLLFKLNKNSDFIFSFLTDMQKFVSVHPVITKIDPTGTNTYLAYETLKLGFIPFSFTYPVVVESDSMNKTVCFRAVVMKLTKIELNFMLREEAYTTVVEETVMITSLLPVKRIIQAIFKKLHLQLFENIDQLQ